MAEAMAWAAGAGMVAAVAAMMAAAAAMVTVMGTQSEKYHH